MTVHRVSDASAAAKSAGQTAFGSFAIDDANRPRWDASTRLVAQYDYTKFDGIYSFTVRRGIKNSGEKVFSIGRKNIVSYGDRLNPEDKADWLSGMGDEPHTLYRLPQIHEAPQKTVFIVEGEKDADRADSIGLIATTNSSGAGKWRDEFSLHLAQRDVVILPDNDQVGRAHAAKIVESVHPLARSVKIIELPDMRENGDLSDWLDAGRTLEELLALVEAAPAITDPKYWAGAQRQFAVDKDGNPHKTIQNGEIALAKMGVQVSYDEFAQRYLLEGLSGHGPTLDDAALTHMRLLAERNFRLIFGKDRWHDIVTDYARGRSFHPVRDYLNGLNWDGNKRLDRWLSIYAGADDNEYVRAVGELVLVAAVRRVRKPGCKFDEMLVLESSQGSGKSSALACLAVREDWFADDLPLDSESKVVMERTAGRWIIELAELKGMKKGEVEHAKAMISRQVDKARLAYGRLTTEQPRQCIFFGTTNDNEYLRDPTGNRRFWPVRVGKFDLDGLKRDRDQLWAEAAMQEAQGCSIRLDERLWAEAGEHQRGREIVDPFYEILSDRLEGQKGKIRAADIWEAVGLGEEKKAQRNQDHNVRLSAVMTKLGWERPKSKLRFGSGPQTAWVKGDEGKAVGAFEEVPRAVVLGHDRFGNDMGETL